MRFILNGKTSYFHAIPRPEPSQFQVSDGLFKHILPHMSFGSAQKPVNCNSEQREASGGKYCVSP